MGTVTYYENGKKVVKKIPDSSPGMTCEVCGKHYNDLTVFHHKGRKNWNKWECLHCMNKRESEFIEALNKS